MYCQHCGSNLADGTKFCPKCGEQIGVQAADVPATKPEIPTLASSGRRFANYVVDRLCLSIIVFICAMISPLLGFLMIIVYYVFFEGIYQKTPGKWITKTKVVTVEGIKPTFRQILGRSFARLIPFESLSFLFGSYPRGWHDSLPNTLVVPDHLTSEQVRAIDLGEMKKGGMNAGMIVIIIVIGLIGIGVLSSIILASLNTARGKGNDAKIESQLSALRSSAEIYYSQHSNYSESSSCASGMFADSVSGMEIYTSLSNYPSGTNIDCNAAGNSYAVTAKLPYAGGYWCVDSTGFSGRTILPLVGPSCE